MTPSRDLRVGSLQEAGQLSARLADRHRRSRPTAAFGLIDDVARIGGQFPVARHRFVRGDLHGDRDKPVVVAFQMRPQQRLELLGTGRGSPVENGGLADRLPRLTCKPYFP